MADSGTGNRRGNMGISRRRMLHVHIDPTGVVRRVMTTDEPEPSERPR